MRDKGETRELGNPGTGDEREAFAGRTEQPPSKAGPAGQSAPVAGITQTLNQAPNEAFAGIYGTNSEKPPARKAKPSLSKAIRELASARSRDTPLGKPPRP